ncbi:MAG: hypothetical protein JNL79_26545 [Myxococcales bacterium]|nr:hypothetical protein [Myxococcales bacterium]
MRLRPSLPVTLVGALVVGLFGALAMGCNSEQQNGQECLKSDDCESKRCVQYVCVDPAAGKTGIDSGTATDAPADAPAEVAAETTPETSTDTGTVADTTATDTAGD